GAAGGVAERRRRDLAIDVAGIEPMMSEPRLDHRNRWILRRRHRERADQRAEKIVGFGHVFSSSVGEARAARSACGQSRSLACAHLPVTGTWPRPAVTTM